MCFHHENVNLILDAITIKEVTLDTESPIVTQHNAIKKITCPSPSPECYPDECKSYFSTYALEGVLKSVFADSSTDRIDSWQNTKPL